MDCKVRLISRRGIAFILGSAVVLYLLPYSIPHHSIVSLAGDQKENPEFVEKDGQPSLNPPSQKWIHDQLTKTLHFLGLPTWTSHNTWTKCRRPENTYYFPEINTLFTAIPKVGSSNLLEALLRAEGTLSDSNEVTEWVNVHNGMKQKYDMNSIAKKQFVGKKETAFSFAVVRNPWTRMVSGYRNKFSEEGHYGLDSWSRKWGMKIIREMRGVTDPELLKTLYPTFEEYLRYLIKEKATGNEHFVQQWTILCIPQINYGFVIPIEYGSVMIQDVWGHNNSSLTKEALSGSYDSTTDPRAQSSALLAKKWLSEMNEDFIGDLYTLYRADFMLMNYSNFSHTEFPLPIF